MSVQTEITRLSNAKSAIKTAIGNKGVTVPSTTKLDGMATLIGQIPTGTDTSDATAAAGDILSGKTAYVNGSKVTGTMPNMGAISGILKGDGAGNVSAATAGTDYATPALVKVSDTQPTETENKLWVDTDGSSGNSYEVPTVAESLAMGMSGAKVGDLVRVNSVDVNGKPTSWKHVPLNEIKCNKNLLDNWCFVGGGSQLGDGVFPINQRGQTIYSGAGYGIDRWRTWNGTDSLTLTSDGLLFISPADNGLFQYFTRSIFQDGDAITISAIIDGNLYTASGIKANDTIRINDSTNTVRYEERDYITFWIKHATSAIKIKAVKLELGSEQTLCHNEGTEENPVWVLNELPDYGEELRKCQRYYQLFRTQSLRPSYSEDCRPVMATNIPAKSTITKNSVTYYTLSSEL